MPVAGARKPRNTHHTPAGGGIFNFLAGEPILATRPSTLAPSDGRTTDCTDFTDGSRERMIGGNGAAGPTSHPALRGLRVERPPP